MLEGNIYLYENRFLKCTRSGFFTGRTNKKPNLDKLYPNNYMYFTNKDNVLNFGTEDNPEWSKLVVTDRKLNQVNYSKAAYTTMSSYDFGDEIFGITSRFISNKGYYDTDTHIRLGTYLRTLSASTGLNLMPLYNCYCDKYLTDLDLSRGYYRERTNKNYKVTAIPIKFNTKYTLALTNPTETFITSTFLKDDKLLKHRASKKIGEEIVNSYSINANTEYEIALENPVRVYNGLSSNRPITIEVTNTSPSRQKLEKFLYLIVQIPINRETRITVLEGRYSADNINKVYDVSVFEKATQRELDSLFCSGVSLLRDDKKVTEIKEQPQVAFSDKLIEYLLLNTIDCNCQITSNIELAQRYFGSGGTMLGIWDDALRRRIFNTYMSYCNNKEYDLNDTDVLGYIDSDVEQLINKGMIKPWQ